MKKLILLIIALIGFVAINLAQTNRNVVLKPDIYIFHYTGNAKDTAKVTVWNKTVQLNKKDGLLYTANFKLSAKNSGSKATVTLQGKTFANDAWSTLKSAAWKGTTKDTVITLNEDSTKTYHRYINLKVQADNDSIIKIENYNLSLKK